MKYEVVVAGKTRVVELTAKNGAWEISLDGKQLDANAVEVAPNIISVLLNGESHQIRVAHRTDGTLLLHTGLAEYPAEVNDPRSWRGRRHGALQVEGRQQIAAPMPGKVVRLLVKQGDAVEAGQGLLVVEAMKMQNEMKAARAGRVISLTAREGATVTAGEVLATIGQPAL